MKGIDIMMQTSINGLRGNIDLGLKWDGSSLRENYYAGLEREEVALVSATVDEGGCVLVKSSVSHPVLEGECLVSLKMNQIAVFAVIENAHPV